MRADQLVDVGGVLGDTAGHRNRVRVQLGDIGVGRGQLGANVDHLGGAQAPRLGLEQQVDGAFTRLVAPLTGRVDFGAGLSGLRSPSGMLRR